MNKVSLVSYTTNGQDDTLSEIVAHCVRVSNSIKSKQQKNGTKTTKLSQRTQTLIVLLKWSISV